MRKRLVRSVLFRQSEKLRDPLPVRKRSLRNCRGKCHLLSILLGSIARLSKTRESIHVARSCFKGRSGKPELRNYATGKSDRGNLQLARPPSSRDIFAEAA